MPCKNFAGDFIEAFLRAPYCSPPEDWAKSGSLNRLISRQQDLPQRAGMQRLKCVEFGCAFAEAFFEASPAPLGLLNGFARRPIFDALVLS